MRDYVNCKFKLLNDLLGFGKVGGYARLRPHMIRKFHSTYLSQGSIDCRQLSREDIDCLQGRGKNRTREIILQGQSNVFEVSVYKIDE
jgi:hypothetical protein